MNYTSLSLNLKNVVVVAEKLSARDVSIDLLRSMPGVNSDEVRVLSAPDRLVVIYPDIETTCEVGNRRIIVNDQSNVTVEGEKLTDQISWILDNNPISLVAYGFNFEQEIKLEDAAGRVFRDLFLSRIDERSASPKADITSLEVKLTYEAQKPRFQLSLSPHPEGEPRAIAKFNGHLDSGEFPSPEAAHDKLVSTYIRFQDDLHKL